MRRYMKGARSERELLNTFYGMGYSVIRAAGSGVNALGPDILAIKKGVCLSFECKAWEKSSLSLDDDQFLKLLEWEENSASDTYIAWRMNGEGWFFIKLSEMEKGNGHFNITKKKAMGINRRLEHVLKVDRSSSLS